MHKHIDSKESFFVQGMQQTQRGVVSKAKVKPKGTMRFPRVRLVNILQREIDFAMTQNIFLSYLQYTDYNNECSF